MTRRMIAVMCLLGLAATCNKEKPPTSPTVPTPAPTLVSVAIGGPNSIQPGDSRQFSATATLSDRSTQDVTAAATWRSNSPVFTVTGGLVTALSPGEGSISVTYQNRGSSLVIVSLPAGTGILTGSVKESTFPIGGARVEVVSGPFAGRSEMTNSSGSYRMYGVVGDLQIRASTDGYVAQTAQVNVPPIATPRRDQILNFDLVLVNRVLTLAGTYRVTLRASSTCGAKIPADVAVREYLATVAQDGPRLSVTLSGAEFATTSPGVTGNHFDGRARPDSVEFTLGSFFYYYYYYNSFGFVERLTRPPIGAWGFAQSIYLTVFGTAAGSATPSTISAALNGTLGLVDAPSGFSGRRTTLSSCNARDHQLVMTRQ
jgi:Bacterial Ig-like domain (group 2)